MAKRPRTATKSLDDRIQDCETHVFFLNEAHQHYIKSQQELRYKQLSAELRILVCETKTNKPILLNVLDELGIQYNVQPQRVPFPRAIPLVGQLGRKPIEPGHLEPLIPLPLRTFVNDALAVYFAPHEYSYRDLVLTVSQQVGSSHEDDKVEELIARGQNMRIGNEMLFVAPLVLLTRLVIDAGTTLMNHAVSTRGYKSTFFKPEAKIIIP